MTTARPPHGSELFAGRSTAYAAARPSYPAAVIDRVVEGLPRGATALDLGCGTGISTRLLAARGLSVRGVDPSEEMISEARRAPSPEGGGSVRYELGTERLDGVAEGSIDLVTCFQSFHWLDPEEARRNFRRVLSPGGRVAVVWNLRDPRDAAARDYVAAIGAAPVDRVDSSVDPVAGLWAEPDRFREVARQRASNPHWLDEDGLLARARSASYFPRDAEAAEKAIESLRRLFARHARGGRVALGQETLLVVAEPAR